MSSEFSSPKIIPQALPTISVVVAVFNGVSTLQKCLRSICQQTYANLDIVVIDGGSGDGTVDVIKKYQSRLSYWVSEKDDGIFDAWNKGIKAARGDWICFIGADDFFMKSDVLERMVLHLKTLPSSIRVAYGQIMVLDKQGKDLFLLGQPWERAKHDFQQIMSLPYPGLMQRKELIVEKGGFDTSFRIAGDYELLLRELLLNDAYFIADLVTVGMMQGGISSKPRNGFFAMLEGRRAQKMHGIRWPGRKWLYAMSKVFCRMLLWEILGGKLTNQLMVFAKNFRRKFKDIN